MRKEPVKNSAASGGVAILSDDSEGGNSRAQPQLSKKERKALKKQEKKAPGNRSGAQKAQPSTKKDLDDSIDNNRAGQQPQLPQSQNPGQILQKKKAMKQQEQIIENFTELTKKYQDLAQKMNQL